MENQKSRTRVVVCMYCQKEFPAVDAAIQNTIQKYHKEFGRDGGPMYFSHGYCIRHNIAVGKDAGMSDEEIKSSMSRAKTSAPDLQEHPELVKLWSAGIFTKEQQQSQQTQQAAENSVITERFKKLAGIRS